MSEIDFRKQLVIKNEKVNKLTNINKDQIEKIVESIMCGNPNTEDIFSSVVVSYYDSMLELSVQMEQPLDLTYNSVKNIVPVVMKGAFIWGEEAIKKSLTAYLFFLCLNENDCNYFLYYNLLDMGKNDTFSGVKLFVGQPEKYNLLDCVNDAVKVNLVKQTCVIDYKKIIKIYKSICGIDLSEFGFGDK